MPKPDSINQILQKSADNWPESFATISPSILRLHRIHTYLHHNMESVVKHHQLQAADFGVLETLRKEPAPFCLSPTQLYCAMLFSSGGLTKVLTRLTNAGLIVRLDNPEDKRSKLVQLSDKGKVLIEQVILELHQKEQRKMASLTVDEQQHLDALLKKLLGVWE
ncbi:MarR family winged helix-turn-helix transcriptional regulator [Shewanella sp. 10N.286.48.A6]|uniref:MarR family winged helix-turn-helix transcriptional regulator n=1 Tax=Shewanella sp. 10N.286.48.A6 TaxID=1880833 RepID=UPI000C8513D4|nr:MarR family transcriptional regulator [Shewanella sp. 10N.286.48.A6]PMH97064.1 transcriptional regulator [Shewanella sp. 10N.286.48.A6]